MAVEIEIEEGLFPQVPRFITSGFFGYAQTNDSTYVYAATWRAAAPGKMLRVNKSTLAIDVFNFPAGTNSGVWCLLNDASWVYAIFNSTFPAPRTVNVIRVSKSDFSTFNILGAIGFQGDNQAGPIAVIDPTNNNMLVGCSTGQLAGDPYQIVTVDRGAFVATAFDIVTNIASGNVSPNWINCDAAHIYLVDGGAGNKGIGQVDRGGGAAIFTAFLGTLGPIFRWFVTSLPILGNDGFLYMIANELGQPSHVLKTNAQGSGGVTSSFTTSAWDFTAVAFPGVASQPEVPTVADGNFLYFGINSVPGEVLRANKNDLSFSIPYVLPATFDRANSVGYDSTEIFIITNINFNSATSAKLSLLPKV